MKNHRAKFEIITKSNKVIQRKTENNLLRTFQKVNLIVHLIFSGIYATFLKTSNHFSAEGLLIVQDKDELNFHNRPLFDLIEEHFR